MEIWKDIKGHEGLYQVSNLGNIKSLNYRKTGKEQLLKTRINKRGKGYIEVGLCGKKKRTYLVHRLVLLTFVGYSNLDINHKDGNPQNNKIENLEYCTKSENEKHKYEILGYKGVNYGKFGKDNPSSKKVNQYNLEGTFIKTWDCIRDITKELGFDDSGIVKCCKGKYKTCNGFQWRYFIT